MSDSIWKKIPEMAYINCFRKNKDYVLEKSKAIIILHAIGEHCSNEADNTLPPQKKIVYMYLLPKIFRAYKLEDMTSYYYMYVYLYAWLIENCSKKRLPNVVTFADADPLLLGYLMISRFFNIKSCFVDTIKEHIDFLSTFFMNKKRCMYLCGFAELLNDISVKIPDAIQKRLLQRQEATCALYDNAQKFQSEHVRLIEKRYAQYMLNKLA